MDFNLTVTSLLLRILKSEKRGICWPELDNSSSVKVIDAISTKVIYTINRQVNNSQYLELALMFLSLNWRRTTNQLGFGPAHHLDGHFCKSDLND